MVQMNNSTRQNRPKKQKTVVEEKSLVSNYQMQRANTIQSKKSGNSNNSASHSQSKATPYSPPAIEYIYNSTMPLRQNKSSSRVSEQHESVKESTERLFSTMKPHKMQAINQTPSETPVSKKSRILEIFTHGRESGSNTHKSRGSVIGMHGINNKSYQSIKSGAAPSRRSVVSRIS